MVIQRNWQSAKSSLDEMVGHPAKLFLGEMSFLDEMSCNR